MFGKRSKYPISDAQSKERMRRGIKILAYIVIACLVTITGLHAVMIVLSESAEFTFWGQTGIVLFVLTAVRLAFPLITELSAIIHTYGALNGVWKGDQKTWGGFIDGLWFLFAAANMVTFFAIERGQTLEGWQRIWLQVGLPISGIISGVMVTKMILADPAHRRAEEEAAAEDERVGNEHAVRSEVENSDAMQLVLARRVWRDYANGLKAKGYDDDEIDFILAHVPELSGASVAHTAGRRQPASPPPPSMIDRMREFVAGGKMGENTHDTQPPTYQSAPGQGGVKATFATSEEEVAQILAAHRAADGQEPPTPRP